MNLKDFFQKKGWMKWDKSQWIILILVGILLMVAAVPTGDGKQKEERKQEETVQENEAAAREDYARKLEQRLKKTLSKIDGAGQVEVMVTLEDSGESIVEKDTVNETSDVQETDSAGGSRAEKGAQVSKTTVYQEESSSKTPFIGKEKMPKVAGVLVVAGGGENTAVKQNISDAVMALFQIEVNRIKVVKMNNQEEK